MGVVTVIIIVIITPRHQAGGQQAPMKYQTMCWSQKPNMDGHLVAPTPCIVLLEGLWVPKISEMGQKSMEFYNNRIV